MLRKIILKCNLYEYDGVVGKEKKRNWLKEKMRLRLVLDKSGYEGFPMEVKSVTYNGEECIINVLVISDPNYDKNKFLKEGRKVFLAVAIKIVGECKIIKIEKITNDGAG